MQQQNDEDGLHELPKATAQERTQIARTSGVNQTITNQVIDFIEQHTKRRGADDGTGHLVVEQGPYNPGATPMTVYHKIEPGEPPLLQQLNEFVRNNPNSTFELLENGFIETQIKNGQIRFADAETARKNFRAVEATYIENTAKAAEALSKTQSHTLEPAPERNPNASKNLQELVEHAYELNELAFVLNSKMLTFNNGNYSLSKTPDIKESMEEIGRRLLTQAAKEGIRITDLPGFSGVDLTGNGTVDAKEVGAIVLAASMQNHSYIGSTYSPFDNKLDADDMKKLLDPKTADNIKTIAKQILQDNGVTVNDAQTDEQFVSQMRRTLPTEPGMKC